jgi:peptide deformylase
MATKSALTYPAKELRAKCTNVVDFTSEEFLTLMQDLVDTLGAYGALGLAAPQLGVNKRIFLTNVDGKPQFFINPRISRRKGRITTKEGCLSFPNVFARVERHSEITIHAIDADGGEFKAELTGMDAVVAQHEYDHLDGVLFTDKVGRLEKSMMLKRLRKVKKKFGIG